MFIMEGVDFKSSDVEIFAVPFNPKSAGFAEDVDAINITRDFPDGRLKAYRGLANTFSRESFFGRLGELIDGEYFVYRINSDVHVAVKMVLKGEVEHNKAIFGLQDVFSVFIADSLNEIGEVGFSSRNLRRIFGVSVKTVLDFLGVVLKCKWNKCVDDYKENRGQLKMAKKLGGLNLGHLYSLASGLDYVEELGWICMSVPYEVVGKFEEEIKGDKEEYKGNRGQLKMVKKLGGLNLGL